MFVQDRVDNRPGSLDPHYAVLAKKQRFPGRIGWVFTNTD